MTRQLGRALVTGGAGYFGGILARHLTDHGIAVVSLDRLDDPAPDSRIVYARADLRDAAAVRAVFAGHERFDAVFHCAAIMGHELPDPAELWSSNVDATTILADTAIAAGVPKLVFTSTICVYGRPYEQLVGEDEPACPIDLYGRSKLAAEQLLASRAGQIDVDSIRCPTVISAGRLGMITILFEFIREGRTVYLVGDGSNRVQFIYAPDLAVACRLAAERPGSHVYHVGAGRVKPLREVYQAVIDEAGSRSHLCSLPERPTRLALRLLHRLGVSPLGPYQWRLLSGNMVYDTTRIETDLGFRPTLTNDEMLREAYRYWIAHPSERRADLPAHKQRAKMGVLRLVKWIS